MREQIINAAIVLPDGILSGGVCSFCDGVIDYVGTQPREDAATTWDAEGSWVLPGFIDIHCHGGGGYDFMDATPEEMTRIAEFHLKHGTTTLVATTMTDRWPNICGALDRFEELLKSGTPLTLHGMHLEGPWLNPEQCGAQDVSRMDLPDTERLHDLLKRYPFIERISAAPELPGGLELGAEGQKAGVLMSMAHTAANFDQTIEAADNGYTLMTHFFSGMKMTVRKNSYRVAGAVEGGLYDDRLYVELITDGKHMPPSLLKLVHKVKGDDRICLITDAMRAAGLPEGSHTRLGSMAEGVDVMVEDDVAKLLDRSAFAGSVATTDRLLRVMHKGAGIDLVSVSRMMSGTPAKVMGYTDRGAIETGKRADLVLLDGDLNVKTVFLGGINYEG